MTGRSLQSKMLILHQRIYVRTNGYLGHRLIGVPTLLLTTTGRRTGTKRTTAVVYARDHDGALVVTASNGGADQRPGWLLNVSANESVDAQIGRHRFTGRAEVIGPEHDDYVRLWAVVNDITRGRYDRYQQQTEREIELVKLHPCERTAP